MPKLRTRIKMRVPQVIKAITGDLDRGMNRAGAFIVATAKRAVNEGHADKYITPETTRNKGKRRNLTAGMIVGRDPSRPGEPPKKLTGTLQSSISFEVIRRGLASLKLQIGVTSGAAASYARRLEFGFKGTDSDGKNINQAPRPFIRPILVKDKVAIIKRIAGL